MVAQTQNPIKMKTLNDNTSKGLNGLNYTERSNTVDARTVPTTAETPSYLVDKRLIDYLLRNVTKASLQDIKEDLISMITLAESVDQIVTEVEEYGYMYKIMNLFANDEAVNQPVTNEFKSTARTEALADMESRGFQPVNYAEAHNGQPSIDRDPTDDHNAEC